jgi:hypothetical protein
LDSGDEVASSVRGFGELLSADLVQTLSTGVGADRTRARRVRRGLRPSPGLLDEFQIHLIPVLVGEGVRLFEDLDSEPIELERTRTIETPSATHLRFNVVR